MQAGGVAPLATVSLPSVVDAVEVCLGSRSVIRGARPKDLVGGRQGWYAVSGAVLTTTGSVCSVVKK